MTGARYLQTTAAIRERCGQLLSLADKGELGHFVLHRDKLPETARLVSEVIRANYPSLEVPFHSRYRHLSVGGRDRVGELAAKHAHLPADERARREFDLVVTSVLLDAGAGAAWSYREQGTGTVYARSEGLGVASYDLFASGAFSEDGSASASKAGLAAFSSEKLRQGFQASGTNPLEGLEGRTSLLRQLGETAGRPGELFDAVVAGSHNKTIEAHAVLTEVLRRFGGIWPGRVELEGINLGDVWRHSRIESKDEPTRGLIPFHKLSQWLTYSLLEGFERYGYTLAGVDQLTGLAEYRNGGLFLDGGVIELRDPEAATRAHAPSSELVIEWRALTVTLLDALQPLICAELGLSRETFPLAKVLEGGTWAAGRKLAKQMRPNADPPLRIESDGTVF